MPYCYQFLGVGSDGFLLVQRVIVTSLVWLIAVCWGWNTSQLEDYFIHKPFPGAPYMLHTDKNIDLINFGQV